MFLPVLREKRHAMGDPNDEINDTLQSEGHCGHLALGPKHEDSNIHGSPLDPGLPLALAHQLLDGDSWVVLPGVAATCIVRASKRDGWNRSRAAMRFGSWRCRPANHGVVASTVSSVRHDIDGSRLEISGRIDQGGVSD